MSIAFSSSMPMSFSRFQAKASIIPEMSSAAQILGALLDKSNSIISAANMPFAKISPYSMPLPIPPILCVFQRMLTWVMSVCSDTDGIPLCVQFSHHSKTSYSEYVMVPAS